MAARRSTQLPPLFVSNFGAEMLVVREQGRRMYSVQQAFLLRRISCNVRSEGEALDAHEGVAGIRGADACRVLREAPPSKLDIGDVVIEN